MDDAKETMCEVHAGQRVIANCSLCQRPLCNKCLGERKGTRMLCQECAVKDIVASYDDERQKGTEEAEVAEVKKHVHVEKRRKVLRIAMSSVLVVEAAALFFLAGRAARAHQWLVGGVDKAYTKSLQTDRCVANLWKIKAALDKFIHENKRPPRTLSELLDNGSGKCQFVLYLTGNISTRK